MTHTLHQEIQQIFQGIAPDINDLDNATLEEVSEIVATVFTIHCNTPDALAQWNVLFPTEQLTITQDSLKGYFAP